MQTRPHCLEPRPHIPPLPPPPSTHAHAPTTIAAHRVEVLAPLHPLVPHLLLPLHVGLRLVHRLPSAAAVARPVSRVSVVAVNSAVLAGIDVVLPSGNSGVGVGVVNKPAAVRCTIPRVDVPRVARAATCYDAG